MKSKMIKLIVLCILIVLGLFTYISNKNNDIENLQIAYYLQEDSSYELRYDEKTYYCLGGAPFDIEHKNKIGFLSNSKDVFIYSIDGYDENEYINVFGNIEPGMNAGLIYVADGTKDIPWYLAENAMPIMRNAIQYKGITYYLFSSTPNNFQVGEKIGEANDGEDIVEIYQIPSMETNCWLAVKYLKRDGVLVYWSDNIKTVPWEFLKMQREYTGEEFFEENQ